MKTKVATSAFLMLLILGSVITADTTANSTDSTTTTSTDTSSTTTNSTDSNSTSSTNSSSQAAENAQKFLDSQASAQASLQSVQCYMYSSYQFYDLVSLNLNASTYNATSSTTGKTYAFNFCEYVILPCQQDTSAYAYSYLNTIDDECVILTDGSFYADSVDVTHSSTDVSD